MTSSFYPTYYLVNPKTFEQLIYEADAEGLAWYLEQGFTAVTATEYDQLALTYPVKRHAYLAKRQAKKKAQTQYMQNYRITTKLGLTPSGKQSTVSRKPKCKR